MAEASKRNNENLWKFAEGYGITRRRFLSLIAAGGATAVLAACGVPKAQEWAGPNTPASQKATNPETPARFKDPTPFIVHDDKSLETRLENVQGLITPNRYFFVRN